MQFAQSINIRPMGRPIYSKSARSNHNLSKCLNHVNLI